MSTSKLSLGPVFFNWPVEKWRDFYFRMADEAPIDSVYLGEVVCSKRAPFYEPVLPEVIDRLQAAGKEVIHSTLALIMTGREMESVRNLTEDDSLMVEANDISAVACLKGRPHMIGPFLSVYNEGTLNYLAGLGATRFCLPVEVARDTMRTLAGDVEAELEVIVFGRLPLAISARCYHARSHQLHKDNCQYVCAADPDGMELETLEDQPFLAVNGTQTLSYTCCNLVGELGGLDEMGIKRFRLQPQDTDMVEVAQIFRHVADGKMEAPAAESKLFGLMDGMPFSDGFFHGREGVSYAGDEAYVA